MPTALTFDRPRIMGVLNVTPDSFSDGGRYLNPSAAANHAAVMLDEGADIIDIGGESTRPGAGRIDPTEQIARTRDIVAAVAQLIAQRQSPTRISIDTTRASVARQALAAGAHIINDVSAGRDDPDILPLAAEHHCPIILMHMLGQPATMQDNPVYDDVVAEVKNFLLDRAAAAQNAGIAPQHIILDSGIGFGKTLGHNLTLLSHLRELTALPYPLAIGTSRKRFLRATCDIEADDTAALAAATACTTALGVAAGVRLFRVHDVRMNRRAADLAWAIQQAK